MTDYTPTTEQVRNAYVRGMRDTFIASAGEHQEEFERWAQARDDEVHASVQSPTREHIAEAKKREMADYLDDATTRERAIASSWFTAGADAVLALFPQPTPSAKPTVQVPVSLVQELREAADVAYKGPNDTDPAMLRRYADSIRRGYAGGGSNLTAAVARVLDVVADALVWQPPAEPVSIADMAPGNPAYVHLNTNAHCACPACERARGATPPPTTPEEGDRG